MGGFYMRKNILSMVLALSLLFPGARALGTEALPVDMGGAKAAILLERGSGQIVAAQDAETKMEVGGLTRLPALLAVCEAADQGSLTMESEVLVSKEAAGISGPTAFVSAGESIAAAALMKAAVMITAGDAIYALAEAAYGSADACLAQMNRRLAQLGIDVSYANIMDADVLLSAQDLLLLGQALMDSGTFTSFSSIFYDAITHPDGRETELASSNRLLKNTVGCNGVATGSSGEAGYCGIYSVTRNETTWLCALIGAPDAAARTALASDLIEYGFSAYESVLLAKAGQALIETVPVSGGKMESVSLGTQENAALLLPRGASYTAQWELPETLTAPLYRDVAVGKVRYVDGEGAELCTLELFPLAEVERSGIWDYAGKALLTWVHG